MKRKTNNKKAKLVAIMLVLVMLISVGYAAIETLLTITGTATLEKQSWNVHFANVQIKSGSVQATTAPTVPEGSTDTTSLTWEVNMDTPGQFYEFNVDVVNGGTIDAMVNTATNSIVTSALTNDQKAYLDYTIKYENGADVEQYDLLPAGETRTLVVKLLFKQDINPNVLPSGGAEGLTLSYEANYVQADNSANTSKVTKVIQPLAIGTTVNYSTTLNGQTLSNWKVFYNENGYTYLIYGDYLENSAVPEFTGKTTEGTFCVYTNTNRKDLINGLGTASNWSSLLTGTLNGNAIDYRSSGDANVWAMGAPTIDLWVDSWNESNPENHIYAREGNTQSDGLKGYYVGTDNENTTTSQVRGLDNSQTLYFSHDSGVNDECYGYFLASPGADDVHEVLYVYSDGGGGELGKCDNDFALFAARPIVCLPSNILE